MRCSIVNRTILFAAVLLGSEATAIEQGSVSGNAMSPIGRVARFFNPRLVEVESRLDWLRLRLSTLAPFSPKPLPSAQGWRSSKREFDTTLPTLTLDLRGIYPLSDIYVVPSHPQPGDFSSLFPLRIKIEAAIEPSFADAKIVYVTSNDKREDQNGYPLRVAIRDLDARYLRLSVLQGHLRSDREIAAISEVFVFSGGEPVSLNATVTSTLAMKIQGASTELFAIDGRTPLGVWEAGSWSTSRGDLFEVPAHSQRAEWTVTLDQARPIDRIVLFPYMLPELAGPGIIPKRINVRFNGAPRSSVPMAIADGGESSTPLVIPLGGREATTITLSCDEALAITDRHLHAMAELEVWSLGLNLAAGKTVSISSAGTNRTSSKDLTDGKSTGLTIFPLDRWLHQIDERNRLQKEQMALEPVRLSLVTESELNATWGASLAISLSLLIPLALVERKRLVSRKQVDQLRKRIASDLHDDIGSNLGSISLIARAAKRDLAQTNGPAHITEDLSQVEIIARESSLAMRDIVWLLERQQDSIGDFLQRMRDTAGRLIPELEYNIVFQSNRTALRMALDAKRHLFLYFKEALHNIVKHSKATEVNIRVYDSGENLVMEIRDNGRGLPLDHNHQPTIPRKLTERANVLEGHLHVETNPNQGTLLRLAVKRAILVAANTKK